MMLRDGASMVYHFMSDDDVERIMRDPHVAFASDSGVLTEGEGYRTREATATTRVCSASTFVYGKSFLWKRRSAR